jgi:hypothetical protein
MHAERLDFNGLVEASIARRTENRVASGASLVIVSSTNRDSVWSFDAHLRRVRVVGTPKTLRLGLIVRR